MKQPKIYMCRECRPSVHKQLKNLKNAFLENQRNLPHKISKEEKNIVEDYAFKNVIKKSSHIAKLSKLVAPKTSLWSPGRVLTVSFIGGEKVVKDRIIKHAKIWMDHTSIELDFKPAKNKVADIRIAFDMNDGSWSYVGTDNLSIEQDQPTMNYGWLTPTTGDEEYRRTVLHEFGHALGCAHEHSNPKGGIPWDKKKAYAYYMQQGWSKEEVDEQVFKKYGKNIVRATKVDKQSIMMYPIPNEITIGDYAVGWNNDLSENDKAFIAKLYP
jgi:serralysin